MAQKFGAVNIKFKGKLYMQLNTEEYLKIHNYNLSAPSETFKRQIACRSYLQTVKCNHEYV